MARVDALDRELKDVENQWAAFQSGDLATFNAKLKAANLPPVTIAEFGSIPTTWRAADVSALVAADSSERTSMAMGALQETGEKD